MNRCPWVGGDGPYVGYPGEEGGVPMKLPAVYAVRMYKGPVTSRATRA